MLRIGNQRNKLEAAGSESQGKSDQEDTVVAVESRVATDFKITRNIQYLD